MSKDNEYYDGTKLLSMLDINGNKPEIYICTTNRTGGKTTYFGRLLFRRWLKNKSKFMLLYRYNYELDDVGETFFKDLHGLFFSNYFMTSKRKSNGIYHELYVSGSADSDAEDKELCGYAVALNNADFVKRKSHLFSDVEAILFDEFQSESNHYCTDEITKFISIHTSIARGQGEQVRYVPVYMLSNQVSIINPYYVEWEITNRLTEDVNFLRGDGFVLENGFIETASRAQSTSGFNRAFKRNKYVAYSSENVYLNDNLAFVENVDGFGRYIATIRYNGKDYGVREYREQGIIYCDDRADLTFKYKISVTTDDHNINYIMLKNNDLFVSTLRYYFEHGCFRFKDLRCKEAILKCISY